MSKNIGDENSEKHLPRIGITMRFAEKGDFYLRREYSEAIEALGGIPLHLPLIPKREFVNQALNEIDGLLLPGSDSDVDSLQYGQEPHRQLGRVEPLRDETDLLLLESSEKRELPILGICFGMQVLNVARGGTLVQDIESEVPQALSHQQIGARARPSHHITIEKDSLLRRLSGGESGGAEDGAIQQFAVNSHHHQSILKPGRNLKVVAASPDGVIEAVEDTRADRFVLGVQWHPELGWETDKFSQAIFKAFLRAATDFRKFRQ